MLAPTKIQDGDKIYHVGDTIQLTKGIRMFGNVSGAEGAGLTLTLPIKIGTDVNGVTLECNGENNLITYSGTRIIDKQPLKSNTSYHCEGTIASYDFGVISFICWHPSYSSSQVMCFLAVAASVSNPCIITFTA